MNLGLNEYRAQPSNHCMQPALQFRIHSIRCESVRPRLIAQTASLLQICCNNAESR